jgi:hypothetical protein
MEQLTASGVVVVNPARTNPLILYISDIHCGSTVGLMPKSIETIEGQEVLPNKFQQWLLSNWDECFRKFEVYRGNRPFWLVLVGDLIEGKHHGGTQIWSGDIADHCNAAVELLKPIAAKAKIVLSAKGTECHSRNDEAWISKQLGAAKCPDTGSYAWDTISMEVGAKLIQVRHHMPATSRVYLESSALGIVLGNTQLSYARHKQRIPDIVVSGHRHRTGIYHDDESLMMCCFAWQGLTRHGHKVVPGSLPKVGFNVMDFVRGTDELPYCFEIRQPLPKRIETPIKWQ